MAAQRRASAKRRKHDGQLRVAIVTPELEQGGIGRLMSYLVQAIATHAGDGVELILVDSRGAKTHPLLSLFPLLRTTAMLVWWRWQDPPDVVHLNLSGGGSTVRKCWLILVSKGLGYPTVCHLHASSYPEFFAPLPGGAKTVIRWILGRCDAFLTLGSYWQDFAITELRLSPARVQVVRCGVPGPPRYQEQRPRRADGEPLHVVFLGRLGERKGTPQLLQALETLQARGLPWKATLAGDGDIEGTKAAAARLGIAENLSIPGWVQNPSAMQLIETADVLALPSFSEGLPVSVLEAFAYGVPVVATPVGGLTDILVDRENAVLVSPGDTTELADALDLVANDDELAQRIGRGGREAWEERLSDEACLPGLIAAWRGAILSASPRRSSVGK